MPNRDGTGPRWIEMRTWPCRGLNNKSDGATRQNQNATGSGFGRFAMSLARGMGRCFGRGQGRGQGNGNAMGGRQ